MKKIDKQVIPYIVCISVLALGFLLFVFNANNLGNNSFFNKYSVLDNVTKMKGNYGIAGYSFDKDTYGMYVDIYKDKAVSGNIAVVGLVLCVMSVIAMIVYYLKQLKYGVTKHNELLQKMTGNNECNSSTYNSEKINDIRIDHNYCNNCDKELPYDTNYCPNCGHPILKQSNSTTTEITNNTLQKNKYVKWLFVAVIIQCVLFPFLFFAGTDVFVVMYIFSFIPTLIISIMSIVESKKCIKYKGRILGTIFAVLNALVIILVVASLILAI